MIEFLEFCNYLNVILLILPPHTTHFLQPPDVACFGPLGRAYSAEVDSHGRYNGTSVDKTVLGFMKEMGQLVYEQRIFLPPLKLQI
jgi:hypothetical protein